MRKQSARTRDLAEVTLLVKGQGPVSLTCLPGSLTPGTGWHWAIGLSRAGWPMGAGAGHSPLKGAGA